ncbi:MAG: antitoxin [Verrucomicrobiales bacterium]|nr:antitoxin [Verrucomicrobiales bacterium]
MKTAKLFQNGQSQAVRLPKEFRFEGESVSIQKLGNAVVLVGDKDPWKGMFSPAHPFSEDFMVERDPGLDQQREELV